MIPFHDNLKWRLFLFMIPLLLLVGAGMYAAFFSVVSESITSLAGHFAEQKVMFYADKATRLVVKDRDIVQRLSDAPTLLAWVQDEANPALRSKALALLEAHRPSLRDQSYFLVVGQSGHYYYNDRQEHFSGHQLRYTLSRKLTRDAWYYATLASGRKCSLNVNHDEELDVTKVWINCLMRADGQTVGMIGTGIDLTDFIHTVVNSHDAGVSNIYINARGFIQAAPHADMIDFASITHDAGKSILDLFDRPQDRQAFSHLMQQVSHNPLEVKVLAVRLHDVPHVVAVSAIEGLPWLNASFVNLNEQHIGQYFTPFAMLLGLAMLLVMTLLLWFIHRMVLARLRVLDANVSRLRDGNFAIGCTDAVNDEIGRLSRGFCDMAKALQQHTEGLEQAVASRTLALQHAVHEAEEGQKQLDAVIRYARDAIVHADRDGIIRSFNPAAEMMFGYHCKEILGLPMGALFCPSQDENSAVSWCEMIASESVREMEGKQKSGRCFPVELSLNAMPVEDERHYIAVIRDITERRRAEERIRQLAHFDALTGLPNRALFLDRMHQALALAVRQGEGLSLFFLDLDGFKDVNDSLGHEAGDRVLQVVARRLRACVREMDTVARLGGDEFTMILPGIAEFAQAERLMEKILAEIMRPMYVEGHGEPFYLGVSIGIALYPEHGRSVDALLNHADQAMYAAKRRRNSR